MHRKILRKPEYPEMESKLYKWFQLKEERYVTVEYFERKGYQNFVQVL